jgi:MFS family permease
MTQGNEILSEPSTDSTIWTKKNYLLLALGTLVKFGDGVEIYLPGVITQKVSCELGLSAAEEGILAIIIYLFQGVSVLTAVPLSSRFGNRAVLLFSLYSSILFTVLCAVVPNYYTLLLSRALIGFCIGLNANTLGVFIARQTDSKEVMTVTSFVIGSVAFPLGSAWASLAGWIFLERMNWRNFVLLTSTPLFIPPIFMLHCQVGSGDNNDEIATEDESASLVHRNEKSDTDRKFVIKAVKASLFLGLVRSIAYGSIMLLPSLIRRHNRNNARAVEDPDPCAEIVYGNQFLILAAVTGAANVIGRPVGFYLRKSVRFIYLQSVAAAIITLSYGVVLTKPGLITESTFLGIAKFFFAIQAAEMSILRLDVDYWGNAGLSLGCGLMEGAGQIGAVIGVSLSVFTDPYIAAAVSTIFSAFHIGIVYSMRKLR